MELERQLQHAVEVIVVFLQVRGCLVLAFSLHAVDCRSCGVQASLLDMCKCNFSAVRSILGWLQRMPFLCKK